MTTRTSIFQRHLVTILALFALITVACGGAAVSQSATERAIDLDTAAFEPPSFQAPIPEAPVVESLTANPVPVPAPATSAAAVPAASGGHNFGSSLAEFTGESANAAFASADATPIEWDDLIPAGAAPEEVFARFEQRLDSVEIGSTQAAALYEEMQAEFDPEAVNSDLDGEKVWLAGFVAPLTYDGDIVTEFLLVPTFGACIHVPPPAPNQTILVSVDRENGLSVEDSWGAVWVEGTLTLASASTDLAETSYTFTSATSGVYDNF